MKWQRYNALITFFPPEDDGRSTPPSPPFSIDRSYRPHVVVDGDSTYLGVRFVGGTETKFEETGRFSFVELYPDVDYSSLVAGVKTPNSWLARKNPNSLRFGLPEQVGIDENPTSKAADR